MTERKRWQDLIPEVRQQFSRNFKARRRELGLTQRAIFEETGVAVSYISNVENGSVSPSLDIMSKLGHSLGVKIPYFFHDEPQESDFL